MTRNKRLVFTLEGHEQNDHHLQLAVFVKKTRQFLDLLKKSTQESGQKDVVFRVVGLSHASPATMECELTSQDSSAATTAFHRTCEYLKLAKEGKGHELPQSVFLSLAKLAHYKAEEGAMVAIRSAGKTGKGFVCQFDDTFRGNLKVARHGIQAQRERRLKETVISTIDGKLERINVHKNENTFTVFSPFPYRSPVICKFQDALRGKVQRALGKFVSVRGRCFYRPEVVFPYKIEVGEMTILPPSENLPTLSDLRGIAPGLTGDKSSEQFVRELRDQWDKDI